MKLAFVFLTILLCCSLVNSVPDCPDGQHRCSNGECHDCCGDVHCQFGGASCGCTICRDYHCQPKCNPVAGWHCCNVDGQADCKKCCDDSDCPIGAECTMFGCVKKAYGDNGEIQIACPSGLNYCGPEIGCKPCCDKTDCRTNQYCINNNCVSPIKGKSKFVGK